MLVALAKVLVQTDEPRLCAAIYGSVATIFPLLLGRPLGTALLLGTVAFLLSYAYFWILGRTQESPLFYVILILGLPLAII